MADVKLSAIAAAAGSPLLSEFLIGVTTGNTVDNRITFAQAAVTLGLDAGGGIKVGTTPIASGTTTGILYDNGGTLGNYTVTGSGTVAVLQTSPTFITPILGIPTSGTLTNCTGLPIGGITGLGTGVGTALAVNVGSAGAFITFGGALGSPSSAGTIPAFTLGGTIAGGGNQINNVIIGTSTPLAGTFTALTGTSGSITGLTGFALRDTSAAFDVTIVATSSGALSAGRTLTFNMQNVAHIISFGTTANTGSGIVFQNAATQTVAALDLASQTLAGGANVTALTQTAGNLTFNPGLRPLQFQTNSGAFTLTAPAADGSGILLSTNDGSAGAITFSGFSVGASVGDALTTANGSKFSIHIWRINGVSGYRVAAHQ